MGTDGLERCRGGGLGRPAAAATGRRDLPALERRRRHGRRGSARRVARAGRVWRILYKGRVRRQSRAELLVILKVKAAAGLLTQLGELREAARERRRG